MQRRVGSPLAGAAGYNGQRFGLLLTIAAFCASSRLDSSPGRGGRVGHLGHLGKKSPEGSS